MNLPNILTGFRFILVGVFYYCFEVKGNPSAAAIVYLVASLTDMLDGYLARKWNQITTFGKLMDPLADKLLLIVALYCLTINGYLPWFILAFVLGKEVIMIIVASILYKKDVVVYSKITGKIATFVFSAAVILMVISSIPQIHVPVMYNIALILFYIAIAIAIGACIQYLYSFWKNRKALAEENKKDKNSK